MNSLRALISEDDYICQQLLIEMLKDSNVTDVHVASTGDAVLKKIDDDLNPDILFCDLNMPGLDGMDLLQLLGERSFKGDIIVCSGCDKRIIKAACKMAIHNKLNLVGSLGKPIDPNKLHRLVGYCGENKTRLTSSDDIKFSYEELDAAISKSQFIPYFQPKIDITGGELVGVESLSRWQHPTRGLLLPGDFLAAINDHGLMDRFNDTMFVTALAGFKVLYCDCAVPTMSFNLSPESLRSGDLVNRFERYVAGTGLKNSQIIIEAVESKYNEDQDVAIGMLNHFRLKGFGLSIDDYGTGYSSLDRIAQISVSEIKIDRRFVAEAIYDDIAASIVSNTIHLAKELGLKTVAEGLEDMADWELMRDMGCDSIQGFLVARPKDVPQFKLWLSSWKNVLKNIGSTQRD